MEKRFLRQVSLVVGLVFCVTLVFVLVPYGSKEGAPRYVAIVPLQPDFVPQDMSPIQTLGAENALLDTSSNLEIVESGSGERCPFAERADRIIVDLTRTGTVPISERTILANKDEEGASIQYDDVSIESGMYTVLLASFRSRDDAEKNAFEEGWFVRLLNETGTEIARTSPLRDMRDDEDRVIERVDRSLSIEEQVTSLIFEHVGYPSALAQPIVPICALFERVSDVSVRIPGDNDFEPSLEATATHLVDERDDVSRVAQVSVVSGSNAISYTLLLMLLTSICFLLYLSVGREADHAHTV